MTSQSHRVQHMTEPCDCYECVGSEFEYTDDGHRFIVNNLKKHTLLEDCERCGRPKTEYRDLGRKGYYVCWWCNDRAAGPNLSIGNPVIEVTA